jgi:hypothetical protein
MRSKILSTANPPSGSTQGFLPVQINQGAWLSAETNEAQIVAAPGTLSGLRVNLTAAPGVGRSRTVTIRKNGSDTALTVTVSDSDTTAYVAAPIAVTTGDLLTITTTPFNNPATATLTWCLDFQGSQPNKSLFIANSNLASSTISYSAVHGRQSPSVSAPGNETLVSANGVLSNLIVRFPIPMIAATRTLTLRKNGVNTALAVSFVAGEQQKADDVNTVTVAPGDRLVLVATGASASVSGVAIGMVFTATTDGEATYSSSSANSPSTSVASYTTFGGVSNGAWTTTEGPAQIITNATTLRRFDIRLSTAPGAGNSWTFNVRVNGANVGLEVVISGTATTGSVQLDVPVAAGSLLSLESVPASGPNNAGHTEWALTTYQLNSGRSFAVFPD